MDADKCAKHMFFLMDPAFKAISTEKMPEYCKCVSGFGFSGKSLKTISGNFFRTKLPCARARFGGIT